MVETNIDLVLNVLTEEQFKNITPNEDELYFVDDNEKPSLQPFKFDAVKLMSIVSGETANEATLLSNGVFASKDEMIRYITDYFNEDSIDIVVTYQTGVSNYLFTEAFQKDKLPLLDNQGQPTQGFTVYSISFKLTMQGAIANISFKLIHNEAENLFAGQTYMTEGVTDDQIQTKEDQALTTTSKEIVGAINEVNAKPTGVYVNGKTIEDHVLANNVDKGDLVFIENHMNFDSFTYTSDLEAIAGNGSDCSFSPDGNYLAVASSYSPFIIVYKRNKNTFIKLPKFEIGTMSMGYGCSFSPDGNYLAVAHAGKPYITVYKYNNDVFTKLPALEALRDYANRCSFSPDGKYLAVTHSEAPCITIYKQNGDTFTKLPALEALQGTIGYACSFSPDGKYLALGQRGLPCVIVYKYNNSNDTFIKLPNLEGMQTSNSGYGCSFSPNSDYLAISYSQSPNIMVYKRSGDTFTKLPDLEAIASTGTNCSFSPDGKYLAVACSSSPYTAMYKRNDDTFTRKYNVIYANSCCFSNDSYYFSIVYDTSPYVKIYKANEFDGVKVSTRLVKRDTDRAKGIAIESGLEGETKQILITEKY